MTVCSYDLLALLSHLCKAELFDELFCTDISQEDSGNYSCEVRGPQSVMLGCVTHYLFVRGQCIPNNLDIMGRPTI